MGIETIPHDMGIPAVLIAAIIVIVLASLLLHLLFPPWRGTWHQ